MWKTLSYRAKLLILSAESTVMVELLVEDESLIEMVKADSSKEACLAYINENW